MGDDQVSLKMRPYQDAAIKAVQECWAKGIKNVLGVGATGMGKTAVFCELINREMQKAPDARFLVLAHRKELIEQPMDRMWQYWPELAMRSGIVMAERDDFARQIVIATVQTLGARVRLERALSAGPFEYIIADECHHSTNIAYTSVFDACRELNPDVKLLGVTATPLRADGIGMKNVYETTAFKYGIKELVKQRWLVPPRWLAIQTGISLANVSQHDGDFTAKQLADVYETDNCFDLVVESHKKYVGERQCIAFVTDVDGAYRLAEKFNEAGITASAADGTTRKTDRSKILADFRANKIQVLCNVGIYTEGLDVPQVSCIHMVRPTKSDSLYTQCIGRSLRPVPGKEDALILDYAPTEARNIVMMGDVLGVEARKDVYVKEDAEEGEVIGGFTFDGDVHWMEGNPMEIVSRELDYLELSPFSWHHSGDHWLTLGLGKGSDKTERTLAISAPNVDGHTALYMVWKSEQDRWPTVEKLLIAPFEEVSEKAEEYIGQFGNAVLSEKNKAWRRQPASQAQTKFARGLGVWREGMTKGECAEAITHKLAVRTIERSAGRVAQPKSVERQQLVLPW